MLHDFKDFLSEDFTIITKFDRFDIPNGIQLFDPQDEQISERFENQIENVSENEISPENTVIEEITDEFSPEMPEGIDNTQILHTKLDLPARSLIEEDLRALQDNAEAPPEEDGQLDPDEVPRREEDDLSSDESLPDETAGRKLRPRNKTVRFQPETYSRPRRK